MFRFEIEEEDEEEEDKEEEEEDGTLLACTLNWCCIAGVGVRGFVVGAGGGGCGGEILLKVLCGFLEFPLILIASPGKYQLFSSCRTTFAFTMSFHFLPNFFASLRTLNFKDSSEYMKSNIFVP